MSNILKRNQSLEYKIITNDYSHLQYLSVIWVCSHLFMFSCVLYVFHICLYFDILCYNFNSFVLNYYHAASVYILLSYLFLSLREFHFLYFFSALLFAFTRTTCRQRTWSKRYHVLSHCFSSKLMPRFLFLPHLISSFNQ